jgi:GxxExxY protein
VPSTGGEVAQITSGDATLSNVSFARDGKTIAFTRGDLQHPADVYVSPFPTLQPVKLTDHNPPLNDLALGRGEVVRWKSKDGMEIEGILIYPVGYTSGKRCPVIANIHGGPSGVWMQTFPGNWGNFAHVWAGKGWLVFLPNVRGSVGYGERFMLANVRDWGGGDYQDIQSGLDDLIKRGRLVECEMVLPIEYDGHKIDAGYRLDMRVDRCVIVENKAIEHILPIHEAQILTYLKLSKLRLGFILNWNVRPMKNGIRRIIL